MADGNVSHKPVGAAQGRSAKAEDKKADAPPPCCTVVHAAHMVYTDAEPPGRVYRRRDLVTRPGLQVKRTELRAYLAERAPIRAWKGLRRRRGEDRRDPPATTPAPARASTANTMPPSRR